MTQLCAYGALEQLGGVNTFSRVFPIFIAKAVNLKAVIVLIFIVVVTRTVFFLVELK